MASSTAAPPTRPTRPTLRRSKPRCIPRSIRSIGSLIVEHDEIAPGTKIVGFALKTPLTNDICRAHIIHSMSLGLAAAITRQSLAVIATGPSAREADLLALVAERPTLAVNGALKLFLDQGLAP